MIPSLLASGLLALSAAAVYAFVARRLGSREVDPVHRLPLRLFAFWWLSVAVNLAITGLATLAAGAGANDLALFVAQAYLERLVLAAGLWALLAYIGFLLTGDRRTWLPFGIYYATYYMLVVYRFADGRPTGVALHAWARPSVVTTSEPSLWALVALAMLLLPPILGCLLYLRLRSVTRSAAQRSRILVIAACIPLWLVVSISAYFLADSAVLQVGNRLLGVAIALAIFRATVPPGARRSASPGLNAPHPPLAVDTGRR